MKRKPLQTILFRPAAVMILVCLCFAVCPKQAAAQEQPLWWLTAAPMYDHIGYFQLFAGHTVKTSSGLSEDNDYFNVKEGFLGGAKFGYIPPIKLKIISFAFELEYTYQKHESNSDLVGGTIQGHNILGNFVVKYPLGVIHPYVGAGIGASIHKVESSSLYFDKTSVSFAWQLMTGVEVELLSNFSVDVGYRYLSTDIDMGPGDDWYNYRTDSRYDFSSHMVFVGLRLYL